MSGKKSELDKRGEFTLNPTCSICNQQEDSVNNLICCSSCEKVSHRDCCKATTGQWTCSQCKGKPESNIAKSTSAKSRRSSQLSSSRQKDLLLKRLEEEKALKLKELAIERDYLKKKYQLLEELADDELEDAKSKSSVTSRKEYVNDWVNQVQANGSGGKILHLVQESSLNPIAPVFEPQTQHEHPIQYTRPTLQSTVPVTMPEVIHQSSYAPPQTTIRCDPSVPNTK